MNSAAALTQSQAPFHARAGLVLALVLCLIWLCPLAPASAQPVETDNVSSELISDVIEFTPGQTFWLGLHQVVRPHWHTYWQNPGDSGEPTAIDWQLPEGFDVSAFHWPLPKRIDVAHLTNFGHDGDYVLLSQITAPPDIAPGTSVTINGHARWLVCEEICIPEEAQLSLTLTAAASPSVNPVTAPLIEDALMELPQPAALDPVLGLRDDGQLVLSIADADLRRRVQAGDITNAFFYPVTDGIIDNAADQPLHLGPNGISLALEKGYELSNAGNLDAWPSIHGVLVFNDSPQSGAAPREGLTVTAIAGTPIAAAWGPLVTDRTPPSSPPNNGASNNSAPNSSVKAPGLSLVQAVVFGIIGGLILNLMPCVFPILSVKALNFAHKADKELGAVRAGGLAYAAGVILSFLVIASIIFTLRSAGEGLGLGFQLQSPWFVSLLAYLMVLIGLNLSGVFEFGGATNLGSRLASAPGLFGSFFTGVLAVVVATPCTAPFMGAALGFTLTQSYATGLLIFASLGLGLALPYLILCFSPKLIRLLPKPGPWMQTFRQVLAFPMYATAAWLIWVLSAQVSQLGLGWALTGLILVGFAAWLWQRAQTASSTGWKAAGLAGVAVSAIAVFILVQTAAGTATTVPAPARTQAAAKEAAIPYQAYSAAAVQQARAQGSAVFLNFTADWCITCKVNEARALNKPRVIEALSAYGVVPFKGDWTNKDADIAQTLSDFGRLGVPLYVLYPQGTAGEPVILPQVLSEKTVLAALNDHIK